MKLQLLLLSLCSFYCYVDGMAQDEVLSPPDIRYPNTAEILYRLDHQFTIECMASGSPVPSYNWKRNGITVDNSSPFVTADSVSGRLRFTNFSEREEGDYVCYASNLFSGPGGRTTIATSLSPPIAIRKIRFNSRVTDPSPTTYGTEYEYLKIPCVKDQITAVDESIEYIWFYGTNVEQISYDNGRLYVDNQGTLHIAYLKQSDQNLSQLRCGLSSASSNIIAIGPVNTLVVAHVDNSSDAAPQLSYKSDKTVAEIYGSVILECVFSGYDQSQPLPIITWTLDDGSIIHTNSKYSVSGNGRALTIRNLVEHDEKNYYCKGKNTIGESSPQAVYLNVTSKPIFLPNKAPVDITVSQGKDAVIPCEARSASGEIPPGPVIWYINGIQTDTQIDRSKFDIKTDSLTIKSVKKPNDIMCVQCVVANSVGQVMGEACVNVILPITLIKPVKTEQVIGKGDTIDLTVSATTDVSQILSYRWSHFRNYNSTVVEVPRFTYYDYYTKEAYINTTGMTDEVFESLGGIYRANISHFYDFIIVDIRVSLKDEPALTLPF